MSLLGFALLPKAQAVVPPPDGGYPNFNTAEGQNALLSLTTGAANTAVGWSSLLSNATGGFNTATGAGSLLFNTADQNTAVGTAALLFNTTGGENTAVGVAALLNNTSASGNTAIGSNALHDNTIGVNNTAIGDRALFSNTIGQTNVATGLSALLDNTEGNNNIAIGFGALRNNTTGDGNVGVGGFAGEGVTTAGNVICIGANVTGENVSGSCYIGNIFGVTSSGGAGVFVDSAGKLGTATSSRRFKEDIQPMDSASEALFALKPVTFRYRKDIDSGGKSQFGLVAEDVEKLNPDLVVRDKNGKPYSVRYEQINAMLLNEFLKEHCKVEQLTRDFESKLAKQEKQIEALTAGLQKVSAQLEASKPAAQVAENNR